MRGLLGAPVDLASNALRRWSAIPWWHSMLESSALASAFLFVFWASDDDPAIGVVSATVLAIASSVLGWSFWVALGAAIGLVARDRFHSISWLAVVGVLNVAQAVALLFALRGLPLVT